MGVKIMSKTGNIDAPDILGITEQQLNLLKAVYKLTTKNKIATPREIELTYAKDCGGEIQKSNLFRQLKILLDKKYLTREIEANYKLNFEGLKKTLDQRKQEYQQKLLNYEQLTNELEEYFKKATTLDKPVVEYLDYTELWAKLIKSIKKSSRYYITAKFPGMVYTYQPYSSAGRGEYMQTLIQKCFEKKELDVTYLTPLDLDYPFTHSMNIFKDKEKTMTECEMIINQLESLSNLHDNFHVMYLENPYGLDVVIPEGRDLDESYIFIRDEKMNVTSGIYINSQETAKRSKETFLNLCQSSKEIKGAFAKDICNDLRKKLKVRAEENGRTPLRDKK
jgi:hypothetical protein